MPTQVRGGRADAHAGERKHGGWKHSVREHIRCKSGVKKRSSV